MKALWRRSGVVGRFEEGGPTTPSLRGCRRLPNRLCIRGTRVTMWWIAVYLCLSGISTCLMLLMISRAGEAGD